MRTTLAALVILAFWVTVADGKPPIQPAKPPASPEDNEPAQAQIRMVLAEGKRQAAKGRAAGYRAAKRPASKVPPLPVVDKFNTGDIGVIRDGGILQVMMVIQVVDDDNMLMRQYGGEKKVFWLRGFSTSGLSDGDVIRGVDAVVEVTGTKRYESANGATRTVPLVEPFPWDITWRPSKK